MIKYQSLTSIATVERPKKNQIYPKGTLYIQVSACKRGGESAWEILQEDGTVADKYAVVIPRIRINPEYLKIALDYQTPEWHARYVGTNINISLDAFKFLEIQYTTDLEKQAEYVRMIKTVDKLHEDEQRIVDRFRVMKEWYLRKVFP